MRLKYPFLMKRASSHFLWVILVLISISTQHCTRTWAVEPPCESPQSALFYAEADTGMVIATDFPFATRVGLNVLKQGGTAVDAALTTAITQIVLRAGSAVSFAGVMTLVHYEATTGQVTSMDASFNTSKSELDPWTIPQNPTSGRTALVPGFIAGVQAAHERFGRLPFSELFEPGIRLAETGFPLHPYVGSAIQRSQSVLGRLTATRRIFTTQQGQFYGPGDRFRQPKLAGTLREIASKGAAYIYIGQWAERFVDVVASEGGVITMDDLAGYEVIWSDPAKTIYRQYEIFGPGLPGLGGVNLIEGINLFAVSGLSDFGDPRESAEALFWLMQISRGNQLSWLSPRELAILSPPGVNLSPESRLTKETAVAVWQMVQKGIPGFIATRVESSTPHSNAIVVVDQWGNIAALAHSINTNEWGQAGIFVDGISIPDAAVHQPGAIERAGPGGRVPQMMSPAVVLRDGRPVIACSSVGFGMHVETFQRLIEMLAFDRPLEETLRLPTFLSPEWTSQGMVSRVLTGDFDSDLLDEVRALGQDVMEVTPSEQWAGRGYWIGVTLNQETVRLRGGAPGFVFGGLEGY